MILLLFIILLFTCTAVAVRTQLAAAIDLDSTTPESLYTAD